MSANHESDADVFDRVVAARRSVRAFKPDPIADELLERIFTTAGKSPSNCNAQPWITHVASGEVLRNLRRDMVDLAAKGAVYPEVAITGKYIEPYRRRQIDAAITLYNTVGVTRDDAEGRNRLMMRNYEMFDAPHAAFFFMLRDFGMREAADVGIYAQTLMLALASHGLGSCPQGTLSYYPEMVRRALGISDDLICLFGLSFGYPDNQDPTCAAITPRTALHDTVKFHQ